MTKNAAKNGIIGYNKDLFFISFLFFVKNQLKACTLYGLEIDIL